MRRKMFFAAFILLAATVLISSESSAQDCKFFYPSDEGTLLEYTNYNKKGREESYQTQKVVELRQEGNATVAVIEATTNTGKKKEEGVKTTFEVKCEDGNFYMNMDDFTSGVNYDQYESNPDVDVAVNSDGLFYPSDLSVGQTLQGGKVEISVMANGMRMFGSTVTVKDRKVEARETITTPAGSFECFKVSSVVEIKSVMKMETKVVQWLAESIGVVKTETLSDKGKLVGTQVLTRISR